MFPVEICGIHSLGRYSREVLNRSTARASGVFRDEKRVRCSSAYRTPEMDTRKREENCSPPGWSLFSSYVGGIIRYGRDNGVPVTTVKVLV